MSALDSIQGAAGKAVSSLASLLDKVNPDVWREFGYVSMSFYSLFLPKQEQIVKKEGGDFLPLVLVHGLGGNRGAWWPFRIFLKLNGHEKAYAFGYTNGDVEGLSRGLVEFVDSVLAATGGQKVDVVAHSLGGIVARHAIQRLGLVGKVSSLVTMATPHGGTYAAVYANTAITRSLRPDSALINDLNHDPRSRYPEKFYSIWSDRDVYVIPAHRMKHEYATNIFVPGISHAQYLVSPRIFRVASRCLTRLEHGLEQQTTSIVP